MEVRGVCGVWIGDDLEFLGRLSGFGTEILWRYLYLVFILCGGLLNKLEVLLKLIVIYLDDEDMILFLLSCYSIR